MLCAPAIYLNAQEGNSVLWRISGNHLPAPSYLLGTMHVLCASDFEIKPKVRAVMQLVKTITFEADVNNTEGSEKLLDLMKPVPGILDTLNAEKMHILDSLFKENRLTAEALKFVSPFGLMSMLTIKTIDCSGGGNVKMMEQELYNMALANSLKLDHLESVDFQIGLIRSMNTIDELIGSLKELNSSAAYMKQLVTYYKTEQLTKLTALMNNPEFMNTGQEIRLLKERNRNWVTLMPDKMKNSPTLFAVGAGHLGGTDGLIHLLREKGYTVTPVSD
ncbi:polysaccharide biosynthesis protein GumN [Niabella ginsenosidivorans]|uniref:Polysaccharide biosynthesis protein GumN n=1 Tax=Niabella ginsenosidivorans TaxID=1176587 RepID=A0A1A9IAR2_9BACT|nr:polysaccharide biosynthesis protein GumN [Niabella ginsenosidivorans]